MKAKIIREIDIEYSDDGLHCIGIDGDGEDVLRCPELHNRFIDGKHLLGGSEYRCIAFRGISLKSDWSGPERCAECLKAEMMKKGEVT